MAFSVANYKVFKDEVTFSMVATADKRLQDNISVCCGKHKVLKTASVYGANASGKTTLFQAMALFQNFVLQSHAFPENTMLNYTPFAFGSGKRSPTRFQAEFAKDGIRYVYGFAYDAEAIREESLVYYPNGRKTKVFSRSGQEYSFGSDKRYREGNARRVRDKSLFLSVSAQFNDEICMKVTDWFATDLLVMCGYDQMISIDILLNSMNADLNFGMLVRKAFKIADFGISNVFDQNKRVKREQPAGTQAVIPPILVQDIRVEHIINGKKVVFPLAFESAGTKRFLSVIGPVISALKNGTTIVIDEIDMSFHTDVCQWIMGLFLDPAENRNGAQLIFNTHEVGLLDQSVVRRDQVWFTMKDWETGEGDLRRLSDYKVRNDLDIRKAYLNGSFGTKPFIAPERLME